MTCNKIIKPEFTKEQIEECGKCRWASGKKRYCCNPLIGCWIGEHSRIIVPDKKIKYPSMTTMGKNFVKAGVKHIASGMEKRSEEEQERLKAICKECGFFVIKTKIGPRCKKCGCNMNIKIRWATTHCPIGKW